MSSTTNLAETERVFTFGYGHTDPESGASLAEKCVIVRAATYERCRELVNARYGNRWALDYPSVEATAPRRRPNQMATPIGVLTEDGFTPAAAPLTPFSPRDELLDQIIKDCQRLELPVERDGHLLTFPDKRFAIAACSYGMFAVDPDPDETELPGNRIGVDAFAGMERFTVAWPTYKVHQVDDVTIELRDETGLLIAVARKVQGQDLWHISKQGARGAVEWAESEMAARARLHKIGEQW